MLNYKLKGKGEQVIVFLHGFLENSGMWEVYINALSESYKTLAIDLPGHGKSPIYKETHSMEFMADKVNEVLEHLQIREAAFIGHSMGGYVSLAYAEKYPHKTLGFMLLNSTFLPDSQEKKEIRLRSIEAIKTNMDTFVKISVPNLFNPNSTENLKSEIDFAKQMARETSVEGAVAATNGMRLRPDYKSVMREFKKPIYLILGEFDQAINIEELKKETPNNDFITSVTLKTGHMAYLENPQETLKIIREFVELF